MKFRIKCCKCILLMISVLLISQYAQASRAIGIMEYVSLRVAPIASRVIARKITTNLDDKRDGELTQNDAIAKQAWWKSGKTYEFKPNFRTIAKINGPKHQGVFPIADLAKEVGMYSATEAFARKHGGDITKQIIDNIPDSFREALKESGLNMNIDVRIHRLYPDMVPAIPGWHCDGEFRETYFSQPDLDRILVSHHLVTTISSHNGGISNTRFLKTPITVDIGESEEEVGVWQKVHRHISALPKESLSFYDAKDGELVLFDARTLHKAMPATRRGWRLFFRCSGWHKPNLGEGQLATQEQVYVLHEDKGW